MKECCHATAESMYATLLQELETGENVTASPSFQTIRDRVGSPWLWQLLESFAQIRLAHLDDGTARIRTAYCRCSEPVRLVVVDVGLLVLIRRLAIAFMRCIVSWRQEGDTIRVERRTPTEPEQAEFHRMLDAHAGRAPSLSPAASDEAALLAGISAEVKDVFLPCVDLAQAWVVAHEVGHAMSDDVISICIPDLINIRQQVENCIAQENIGQCTAESWTEEIIADVFAAHLLFAGEMRRAGANEPPGPNPEFFAAARIAGAAGLTYEIIYRFQCEFAVDRNREVDADPHPPSLLRWSVVRDYLAHQAGRPSGVDITYLGQVLAQISHTFPRRKIAGE